MIFSSNEEFYTLQGYMVKLIQDFEILEFGIILKREGIDVLLPLTELNQIIVDKPNQTVTFLLKNGEKYFFSQNSEHFAPEVFMKKVEIYYRLIGKIGTLLP